MNVLAGLAPGSEVTLLGLSVLVQVIGVVLVAGLLAHVGLGRRAAARHGLWLGALLWVLASPLIAAGVNRAGMSFWSVNLPFSRTASSAPPRSSAPRHDALPEAHPDRVVATGPTVAAARAAPARLVGRDERKAGSVVPRVASPWPAVLGGVTLVWAVGVLIGLARIAAGWGRIAAMTRAARPLDIERHGETLAQVKATLGVNALPPVVTSRAATGPVAVGVVRSYVVLPEGLANALTPRALRDVLVHECAHVFRRDPWVGLLQRLAAALYWPHPLVHYLNAQLAHAREEVCDNFVIHGGDACGYARTLLTLTELCRPPGACRAGLGLLGLRWTLADRVAGLLDPGRVSMTRTTLRTKLALASALIATGLLVTSVRLGGRLRADEPAPLAKDQAGANSEGSTDGAWSIQGVVVDEQDRPVAGAVVRLPGANDQRGRGRTTAADGTFTLALGGLPALVGGLVAEADGGVRVGLARFEPPLSYLQPHQTVRLVLKPTRVVSVRVKDAAGVPVPGVLVAVIDPMYRVGSTTGTDGTALLGVAADARVNWVLGHKAELGFDYYVNSGRRPVSAVPPLPAEVSLTLNGARTVRIKAVDSSDRPLPGIRLVPSAISKPGKGESVRTDLSPVSWVTTDERGIAVFDWLPKSLVDCKFQVGTGDYSTPDASIRLEPGDPPELTIRLLRTTRLSGMVRLPDGAPRAG